MHDDEMDGALGILRPLNAAHGSLSTGSELMSASRIGAAARVTVRICPLQTPAITATRISTLSTAVLSLSQLFFTPIILDCPFSGSLPTPSPIPPLPLLISTPHSTSDLSLQILVFFYLNRDKISSRFIAPL
jgi:hypothetical protein